MSLAEKQGFSQVLEEKPCEGWRDRRRKPLISCLLPSSCTRGSLWAPSNCHSLCAYSCSSSDTQTTVRDFKQHFTWKGDILLQASLKARCPHHFLIKKNQKELQPLAESELGAKQTRICSCFFTENTFLVYSLKSFTESHTVLALLLKLEWSQKIPSSYQCRVLG